jgi:hypothetical protein
MAAPIQKLPLTSRNQLLDGGVDRGVFPTDAGAGQHPEQRERPEIPRQAAGDGGDQINQHRQREQFLAAEPVGEPAEEQRAGDGTDQIEAGGGADLAGGQVQCGAVRQRAGQGADDGHLQPVQDPGDPQGEDDQPVEAAPGQAVQPVRHIRFVYAASIQHCPPRLSVAYSPGRPTPEKPTDGCIRDLG